MAGAVALEVSVGVDQAGQHVLPGGVDLDVARRAAGRAAADGDRIERHHRADRVALDHDVDRTAGRRPVAVHHRGVADHEALRPHAMLHAPRLGG